MISAFPPCVCRCAVGELLGAGMGEIEGSYRVLQTPGTRLGAQFNAGISTLEPGQSLSGNMISGSKSHSRGGLQIRVQGLDDSQEFFDIEVSFSSCTASLCFLHPCDEAAVCDTAGCIKPYSHGDILCCVWLGFVTAATWLWCLNPFLIKASYSGNPV